MDPKMKEEAVIIVGAGPSGIAMSACLNHLSVPHILLEREDCLASLWTKKTYDRLHLHATKQFCELPYMSYPADCPTFVPRDYFLQYLKSYASHFNVKPLYHRSVESATYDEGAEKWCVKARNMASDDSEGYIARFLVVATGGTSDVHMPEVEGLESFNGEVLHSTMYKSGGKFTNKSVLVVGSGNSGMEIALDLSNIGAKTSIVVRSPVHILNRYLQSLALFLLKYLPLDMVDGLLMLSSRLIYGDMTKYGIPRPKEGPSYVRLKYGRASVIDVGTCNNIKSGKIQVLPSLTRVVGNNVEFANGKSHPFDVIILATGFKASTNKWLKHDGSLIAEDGFVNPTVPQTWKGRNGLYCVGLSREGFDGAGRDAVNIAADIKSLLE